MHMLLASMTVVLGLGFGLGASAQSLPVDSPQATVVEALVHRAVDRIEAQGRAAFPEFRKKGSTWRPDDLYLFVTDLRGTVLLNAGHPSREGKNWLGERDADGKQFHKDFVEVVTTSGAGWVDYMFPRPGESVATVKWSYVCAVTIDGTPGLVGAGFYLDE